MPGSGEGGAEGNTRMVDKLVTCDWVAEHGNDGGVRLVEVDVDTDAYAEGHIEGAVGWNWTTQLQDQTRRDILTGEALAELLSASGIGNDTHVVLYGDNNNWFAAYALWLIELYGHESASLMDGGRVKWLAENRPATTDEPNSPIRALPGDAGERRSAREARRRARCRS